MCGTSEGSRSTDLFESFWVKVKAIYKTAIRKVREHRTRGMLRDREAAKDRKRGKVNEPTGGWNKKGRKGSTF